MADEQSYYVSWISIGTDPYPRGDPARRVRKVRREEFAWHVDGEGLKEDWPGVPVLRLPSGEWVADTGPNLAALLHPKSKIHERFPDLQAIYLLYEEGGREAEPVRAALQAALETICARRGLAHSAVRFVPIGGITDPTNHEQIMVGLRNWIRGEDDPFDLRSKGARARQRRIHVNIDPGTPADQLCWFLLRWSPILPDEPGTVMRFWKGDGGPVVGGYATDQERVPVREFPFNELTRFSPRLPTVEREAGPPGTVTPVNRWERKHPRYQELMTAIEKAAILGMPVLLQGPPGSGKTFLANHYHEHRQRSRKAHPPAGTAPATSGGKKYRTPERSPGGKKGGDREGKLVIVVLSEYANVGELKDMMFGWAGGAFPGAEPNEGFLGEAHQGTLFLDEIHHLDPSLRPVLLRPLNDKTYCRKGESDTTWSDFDLVLATNDPDRLRTFSADFLARIERIVLTVPSFHELQGCDEGREDLWAFWTATLQERCRQSQVTYSDPPGDCRAVLAEVLAQHPLPGNWRDLQRLADNLVFDLASVRAGRPASVLDWDPGTLHQAIGRTFPSAPAPT
jgi:hypothetical protein